MNSWRIKKIYRKKIPRYTIKNINMSLIWTSLFDYFDAIYCINLNHRTDRWKAVQKEFEKIWILDRVIRFSAIETPENGAIGCLLSHRAIIQKAKEMNWKNVLVFEDDIVFRKNLEYIKVFLEEAEKYPFDILYFGGLFNIKGVCCMRKLWADTLRVYGLWCTFAICYTQTYYDKFLSDYPDGTIEGIKKSLIFKKYKSIDDRLIYHQERVFCIGPKKIICNHKNTSSDIQKYTLSPYKLLLYWTIGQLKYLQTSIHFLYKTTMNNYRLVKRLLSFFTNYNRL